MIIVALLPSWGMSNAVATLVGQNLGAGKPDRAERSVWLVGLYNMVVPAGRDGWCSCGAANRSIAVFTSDPAVPGARRACLRVVSYGYAFYAWGMVLVQAFNGAGDTAHAHLDQPRLLLVLPDPLALGLARGLAWGPTGVFFAITIAEALLAVVGLLVFRRAGRGRRRSCSADRGTGRA